jgi:hypothetical protein
MKQTQDGDPAARISHLQESTLKDVTFIMSLRHDGANMETLAVARVKRLQTRKKK